MSKQEVNQFVISKPPSDGITKIKFLNKSNKLLVSSWDTSVTLYDINLNDKNSKILNKSGVLDCDINCDDTLIFSGGCDNIVKMYNIDKNEDIIIGEHSKPIRCINYSNENNILISGSWDNTVKLWDIKSNNNNINSINLGKKVFAMSTNNDNKLIIGTSERKVFIYDLRNMNEPYQTRDSSLKYQTRYIAAHPNNKQYILSSIEGRVAVEYFDTAPEIQKLKYAFKCHRITNKSDNTTTIYPVNTICFHPIYHTFASGGGDGIVNIWDALNKKRICQLPNYKTSISSLSFNNNGTIIAISESYTWETGNINNKINDNIYIRYVKESESKPKMKNKK